MSNSKVDIRVSRKDSMSWGEITLGLSAVFLFPEEFLELSADFPGSKKIL
jgi:hypothetical protein